MEGIQLNSKSIFVMDFSESISKVKINWSANPGPTYKNLGYNNKA
jgi:hypothetical protein